MKSKYKMNMATGGVLFAFGLGYFILSWQIAAFKGLGAPPIDARFVPRMWGVLLMVLSALVFLRGLREYLSLKKAGKLDAKGNGLVAWVANNREVVLTFLCLLIYIALLKPVGFIIMSAAYIFAESLVLTPKGRRKPALVLAIAIVAAVIVDYIFVNLLHVLLPSGILGW